MDIDLHPVLMKKPDNGKTGAARFRPFVAHECGEMRGRKAPIGARYGSPGWSKVTAHAADLAEPWEGTHAHHRRPERPRYGKRLAPALQAQASQKKHRNKTCVKMMNTKTRCAVVIGPAPKDIP